MSVPSSIACVFAMSTSIGILTPVTMPYCSLLMTMRQAALYGVPPKMSMRKRTPPDVSSLSRAASYFAVMSAAPSPGRNVTAAVFCISPKIISTEESSSSARRPCVPTMIANISIPPS